MRNHDTQNGQPDLHDPDAYIARLEEQQEKRAKRIAKMVGAPAKDFLVCGQLSQETAEEYIFHLERHNSSLLTIIRIIGGLYALMGVALVGLVAALIF